SAAIPRRAAKLSRQGAGARGRPLSAGPSKAASVARAIDQPLALQPRHEGAKLAADLLQRMPGGFLAHTAEIPESVAILVDPFVGELAGLDVAEQTLHGLAHLRADDLRAARHVAVLGGVADRVAHVGDAALVNQIDD